MNNKLKLLSVLIWSAIFQPYHCNAQAWREQRPDKRQIFSDIVAKNDSTALIVTEKGDIYRTFDKGNVWQKTDSFPNLKLLKAQYVNGMTYVLASKGQLLKSTNFGNSWTALSIPDSSVQIIHFPTVNVGYVFSDKDSNKIFKTIDGGINWNILSLDKREQLIDLKFTSENIGFAICRDYDSTRNLISVILKTTDGGITWSKTYSSTKILNSLSFYSNNLGFAIGQDGSITRTSNGGTNWTVIQTPTSKNLNELQMITSSIGYACGNMGIVLKTINGGVTWQQLNLGNEYLYHQLAFSSINSGWVAMLGNRLMFTQTGGQ